MRNVATNIYRMVPLGGCYMWRRNTLNMLFRTIYEKDGSLSGRAIVEHNNMINAIDTIMLPVCHHRYEIYQRIHWENTDIL